MYLTKMNYMKHYNILMDRALTRTLTGYFERHHVVPRCVGGSDRKDNIIRLTPEEHYVAHQLLVKIYPGKKGLLWATMIMTGGADHQPRKNKLYGWLRRRVSEHMSGKPKSLETRALLAAANTGKKFGPERCANISKGKTGRKTGPFTVERRLKIAIANTGKSPTLETRAKMRAAKLGKKQTPEHVASSAAARVGQKRSSETCEKLRITSTGRNLGGTHSKQTKIKMGIGQKQSWAQRKINQLAFALC